MDISGGDSAHPPPSLLLHTPKSSYLSSLVLLTFQIVCNRKETTGLGYSSSLLKLGKEKFSQKFITRYNFNNLKFQIPWHGHVNLEKVC